MSLPINFDRPDVSANRSAWDRVHYLAGDSLFHGTALGAFASDIPTSHPLYQFRSIASMANWALEQSGSSDRFVYMYQQTPQNIRDFISLDIVRSGDSVILEDAGGHSGNPDAYEAYWTELRAAVTDLRAITCVMMDMFEFPHDANLASDPLCQYETPMGVVPRTMNEATRAAARRPMRYPGETRLLPMRRIMTDFRNEMMAEYGLDPFNPDGVHMRVWAQLKMAGVICKAVGARVTNVDPLVSYAIDNLALIRYGSSSFDADAAELYVRDAFLSEPYDIIVTEGRAVLSAEDGAPILTELRH